MKTCFSHCRFTWISLPLVIGLVWALFVSSICFAAAAKDKEAHLVFEKQLREMLTVEKAITQSIEKNDIGQLRKQLAALEATMREAQLNLDRSLLLGAWSSAEVKKHGHALTDRLETLKILNFIGLAFTSDYYPNPTKTVSASVKDSINRFFVELKLLTDGVARTNQSI